MNIVVKTSLMQDKIKDLLDGGVYDGVIFSFVEKKGIDLIFNVSGDNIDDIDVTAIAKKAIRSTDYGRGIYFSVVEK